mmetsp:Transcript_19020/g.40461  ORF Transcript_19020/g.40461 Transcript_19020/m.40461 type:complete len:304 (-) Transcript_19020:112-1023(-)
MSSGKSTTIDVPQAGAPAEADTKGSSTVSAMLPTTMVNVCTSALRSPLLITLLLVPILLPVSSLSDSASASPSPHPRLWLCRFPPPWRNPWPSTVPRPSPAWNASNASPWPAPPTTRRLWKHSFSSSWASPLPTRPRPSHTHCSLSTCSCRNNPPPTTHPPPSFSSSVCQKAPLLRATSSPTPPCHVSFSFSFCSWAPPLPPPPPRPPPAPAPPPHVSYVFSFSFSVELRQSPRTPSSRCNRRSRDRRGPPRGACMFHIPNSATSRSWAPPRWRHPRAATASLPSPAALRGAPCAPRPWSSRS